MKAKSEKTKKDTESSSERKLKKTPASSSKEKKPQAQGKDAGKPKKNKHPKPKQNASDSSSSKKTKHTPALHDSPKEDSPLDPTRQAGNLRQIPPPDSTDDAGADSFPSDDDVQQIMESNSDDYTGADYFTPDDEIRQISPSDSTGDAEEDSFSSDGKIRQIPPPDSDDNTDGDSFPPDDDVQQIMESNSSDYTGADYFPPDNEIRQIMPSDSADGIGEDSFSPDDDVQQIPPPDSSDETSADYFASDDRIQQISSPDLADGGEESQAQEAGSFGESGAGKIVRARIRVADFDRGDSRKNGGAIEHVIVMKDVKRTYAMGEETVHALRGVSFTIDKGEFVSIMGPSGSGKSTCMNMIGCLDRPTGGIVEICGKETAKMSEKELAILRNKTVGFVFQQYHLLPLMTVLENVMLPLRYLGLERSRRVEVALKAIERVGLSDRATHLPNELSGGQKQRTAIARATVTGPSIILADEPTGALDSATGKSVINLFREINETGTTIVIVTHDPGIGASTKRCIKILDGLIQSDTLN